MNRRKPEDVLEEVEFLRDLGLGTERICERLKMKPAAIGRALYRAERPDLGRPFNALDRRLNRPSRAKIRA